MKNTFLLLSLIFLFSTTTVNAEETQDPSTFQERQNARVTKVQERKETIETRVTERAENRQDRRASIAENHANRLENRFGIYSDRLTAILEKIQTRLEKAQEEGGNTTAARQYIQSANTSLVAANAYASQAVTTFRSIDPAKYEEQRNIALQAKTLAEQARQEYSKAQTALKSAVEELKKL